MMKRVDQSNLMEAAVIHSESWKKSHQDICTAEFIEIHTPERQKQYLETELAKGAQLFMLIKEKPVGIVSVYEGTIENLYVLPQEQNKGYGTELLRYAMAKCNGIPVLWVLNTNKAARRLYERLGFEATGSVKTLSDNLCEIEFRFHRKPDEK